MIEAHEWEFVLGLERSGVLEFHTDGHREFMLGELDSATAEARLLMLEALRVALVVTPGWMGKVIKSPGLGIHFGRDFNAWKVAGWVQLLKGATKLWLRPNTPYSDLLPGAQAREYQGTPHSRILTFTSDAEMRHLPELLARSQGFIDW